MALRNLTAVGAVGDPELLGQECRGAGAGASQMEEDTALKSAQLCWGSGVFGKVISLKTEHTTAWMLRLASDPD